MDDRRFDDLTRSLVRGLSRRAAVRGGVASLLGTLGLRSQATAQVTQAQCGNKICAANPAICTNGCVCCVYANGNSRCRLPGTCSPGTEVPPPTTAPPTTTTPVVTTTTTSTTPEPTTTTTSTTTPAPVVTTGSVDATDPTSACFLGQTYDATVFQHGGGRFRWRSAVVPVGVGRSLIRSSSCTPARVFPRVATAFSRTTTAAAIAIPISRPRSQQVRTPRSWAGLATDSARTR